MAIKIDTNLLRSLSPPNLASYFLRLLQNDPASEDRISSKLFNLVESEALSPKVLSVWLSISRSPKTLLRALQQDFSISTRLIGIKNIAKSWRTTRWRKVWDEIGGTAGFASLFAQFSVTQVKIFFNHMRRCFRGVDVEAKSEIFTELLDLLLQDSGKEPVEERPLIDTSQSSWYSWLLPVSHSPFQDSQFFKKNRLVWHTRHRLLRQYCSDVNISYGSSLSDMEPLLQYNETTRDILPGYSESMMFSLQVLRQLVEQPHLNSGKNVCFIETLINPLVRRTWNGRRQVGLQQLKEVIDLSLKFLKVYPEEANRLKLERKELIYYIVISWATLPSEQRFFRAALITILQRVKVVDKKDFWLHLGSMIDWVERPLQYDLLQLIFVYYCKWNIHISLEHDLRDMGFGLWPQAVFLSMDQKDGLELLQRLRKVNGDEILNTYGGRGNYSVCNTDGKFGDITILLGVLGAPEDAKAELKDRMAATGRVRDQKDRASSARSTIYCGVATGSLELYGETLGWARRFVKDPLTARDLFSRGCLDTIEALGLLSGIPEWPGESLQLGFRAIRNRIKEANRIILATLDIAFLALREPSFRRWDYAGVLDLLSNVVKTRLRRSKILQKDLNLSDGQLYALVWEDTLALSIQIENKCLQPGHERISFGPMGPLSQHGKYSLPDTNTKAYLEFVDALAKERDALWKGVRLSATPEVITLPPSLPRGLAIQHLLGDIGVDRICGDPSGGYASFISSRAEATVFCGADLWIAIPNDHEINAAVGPFVDDYGIALKIYLRQSVGTNVRVNQQIRRELQNRAWGHALEILSHPGMDEEEAMRFWDPIFQKAGCLPNEAVSLLSQTSMEYPLLPQDIRTDDTVEWNPADDFQPPAEVRSRSLSPNYLDLGLNTPSTTLGLGERCHVPHLRTVGFSPPAMRIWDLGRLQKVRRIPAVWEGITVSSLLYLDSRIKRQRSIHTTIFPSPSEPRYPPLYLADEFLQRSDLNLDEAIGILKSPWATNVPPTLLIRLAKSAFKALAKEPPSSSEHTNVESLAFQILILVIRSDRPHLAFGLVIDAILEFPDASSWHRQFMSERFLKSLPSRHAPALMREFANRIRQKLEEQAAGRKLVAETKLGSVDAPLANTPYVKITTIKLLAQLLNGSLFVSEDFSVEILSDLLHNVSHIDIRSAIINSMLGKLQNCQEGNIRGTKIISAFEALISIAGSPNERQPLTEEEWLEADRTKSPPKLYEGAFPPIFYTIVSVSTATNAYHDTWRIEFTKKVVMTTIELSITSHKKWLDIFAAKHNLKLSTLDLPILPTCPAILAITKLTPTLLDLQRGYIMTNLLPSQELKDFNTTLQDKEMSKQSDVRHWLKLYNTDPSTTNFIASHQHPAYILSHWDPNDHLGNNDIQLQQVSEYAFLQAKALIEHHSESHKFEIFMTNFRYTKFIQYDRTRGSFSTIGYAGPVIRRIIAFIYSLRTEAWQKSPRRNPTILPRTLKYELWLFPYPQDSETTQTEILEFAEAIVKAMEMIAQNAIQRGVPHHEDFSLIKTAALETAAFFRANVACEIFGLKLNTALEWNLRMEIVQALILGAAVSGDELVVRGTRRVLREMQASGVESVRMRGRELGKRLKYQDKEWMEVLLGREGDEFGIVVEDN